jgi:hypothetical protein
MWNLDGVAITLDVLEFGWFVELEGPVAILPEMARSFGLNPDRALRESYSVLARKHMAASKKKASKAAPEPVPATA